MSTDTAPEPAHWPSSPALVYIGTDGTACTLDRDQFEPSLMGARERAICRAFLECAAQKLANFDAVGDSFVTQGPPTQAKTSISDETLADVARRSSAFSRIGRFG